MTRFFLEPVRNRLISLEVAKTIVRLSTALYPPAAWMRTASNLYPADTSLADITFDRIAESWTIRAGLSSWAGRLISELQDDGAMFPGVVFQLCSLFFSFSAPSVLPRSVAVSRPITHRLHAATPDCATPPSLRATLAITNDSSQY
jgi:hypothetical protein